MEDEDHNHFQGRSLAVLTVSIVFICCSFLFVFFRIISRGAIVKRITSDDWLMVIAWLLCFGMTFSVCFGTAYGLGRHEYDIPESWQTTLHKSNYAFSVLYNPALMAEKTSILVFYLSLSHTRQVFRWATIATLVVVNAGGLALTLLSIFQCRPVGAVFDSVIPENAYCTDIVTIYLSSAPLNIITDLAILFLPLPILTSMRMPRRQKIILIVTFSFGAFAAAVDVVRISALQSAAQTRLEEIQNQLQGSGTAGSNQSEILDISWYAAFSFMWSVIEVNVGVMCGCVPALKPLVSKFIPDLLRNSADDATIRSNSVCRPTLDMAETHRVPSVSDDIHHQRPSSTQMEAEKPMDMMDFLTTPDMTEIPHLNRTQSAMTNTTRHTGPQSPIFFDFVNMQQKKSLVHLSNRESILPIALVTVLFFIWGFEYGLLDVLNKQFQMTAHMTAGQTVAISSTYYAGYVLGPWLIGKWVLQNWGFKACFSVGLAIYACGTLIFWPAAVLTSFPAYLIVNLIVGSGLSILEVAANPFIALCGPAEYGEIRLNLSQGVQAIGTVIAPLIAEVAIVSKVSTSSDSLVSTQYAYLGIALFTILLAVVYHYIPLPEASDQELEDVCERFDHSNTTKIRSINTVTVSLAICSFGQFCYVGAQQVNGTGFGSFLGFVEPGYDATTYTAIAHTAFVASRFAAAGLGFFIKPRILLLGFFLGAILFQALAVTLNGGSALAMMIMVFFMEGPLFSLLFAQAIRGQGRRTKLASVVVTSMISGGAAFAPASRLTSFTPTGGQSSLVVAVAVFAAGAMAPIILNLSPKLRHVVDPVKTSEKPGGLPSLTESNFSHRRISLFKSAKHHARPSSDVEFREQAKP